MTFDAELYGACMKMLEIICDEDSSEDEKAMARSTIVEAVAPEYMEAMLESMQYEEDDCDDMVEDCGDPGCPHCSLNFMDAQDWIDRSSLN